MKNTCFIQRVDSNKGKKEKTTELRSVRYICAGERFSRDPSEA